MADSTQNSGTNNSAPDLSKGWVDAELQSLDTSKLSEDDRAFIDGIKERRSSNNRSLTAAELSRVDALAKFAKHAASSSES